MSDGSHHHISNGVNSHTIREICKYGWLRVIPNDEKKISILPKKVWIVFCIHDEKHPNLEVYADKKVAILHKPEVYYTLEHVLHISPTICPLEGEFEFVITLASDAIRFTAPSWNQMMTWIEGINSKLRELKLLPPKENLYSSHLPEVKRPLLPTRDPNSPLPMPPSTTYIPPGVEPIPIMAPLETGEQTNNIIEESSTRRNITSLTSRLMLTPEQMTRQTVVVDIEGDDEILSNYSGQVGNRTVIEVPPQYLPFDMFDLNAITEVLRQINNTGVRTSVNNARSTEPFNSNQTNGVRNNESSPGDRSSIVDEYVQSVEVVENGDTTAITVNVSSTAGAETSPVSSPVTEEPVISELVDEHVVPPSRNNTGLYEHLFLPSSSQALPISNIQLSQLPRMGRGRANQRGRRRNNNSGENSGSAVGVSVCADRIRNTGGMSTVHVAIDGERTRNLGVTISQRLLPAPHPFSRQVNGESSSSSQLTLREQQVMQLRKEMAHPAGVRLQLRRKDCQASIAFVDAYQIVWIAGWKQKENPMLYNALHIGDQLLSIGGKLVFSAVDTQKIIRAWPSLYIEFVIRRVPCGRVYALRRECDGQNLGIIQEGNTAEIKDILPNSIAALQGMTARTPTMDGLSLTTWMLTEINSRPLNLFFKDNEVKDRLNAVGLDISLLIQPFDLIKQLKKQLKTMKNYKEYLVQ